MRPTYGNGLTCSVAPFQLIKRCKRLRTFVMLELSVTVFYELSAQTNDIQSFYSALFLNFLIPHSPTAWFLRMQFTLHRGRAALESHKFLCAVDYGSSEELKQPDGIFITVKLSTLSPLLHRYRNNGLVT